MTRSTLLYVGMLVLVVVGFEAIRRVGNTLQPPHHIAGRWDFAVPASPLSCPPLAFPAPGKGSLQVEQSGHYLMLTFTDVHSTKVPARFANGKLRGSGVSPAPCAADARVHVRGGVVDDHLELSLTRSHADTSVPAEATLVLSATRPSGSDSPTSASP